MQSPERYHSFDGLRGAMMLLGVVLHSAVAYSTLDDVWWLKDPRTTQVMDIFALFLHTFRLPAFFVMAGFFAALLFEKRGAWGFLDNRMSRLGLPFLLGMLAMYPFLKTVSVWAWFAFRHPDPAPLARTWGRIQEGRLERGLDPMHLWFLEVLLWTCLAAAAAAPWLNRLRNDTFRRLLMSRWLLPVMTLATFATLLPMDFGVLDTPHSFSPMWRLQAAYAVFFVFGWGMYRNRELLPVLERHGWGKISLGVLAMAGAMYGVMQQLAVRGTRVWPAFLLTAAFTALIAWLMILGLIGLFLRFGARPSARVRYLSDSAYWLYLAHPPVLVFFQIPMMYLPIPAGVKFVLGIVFAMPVLLWSYDRLVRPTWLGVVLNGKRQPRWNEQAEPIELAA